MLNNAAPHFVLASWVLAGAFLLFAIALLVGVYQSWRSQMRRPVGVIEATQALKYSGVIDDAEARDLLKRYERQPA